MQWATVMCPDGPYAFNTEGVTRLIRAYAYARAVDGCSQLKTTPHHFGPDITLVETNWDAVWKQRDHHAKWALDDFFARMSRGMKGRDGMDYLEGLLDDRDGYTSTVQEKQRRATKETMKNLRSSLAVDDGVLTGLEIVRDGAADTELVLASVALSPAALTGLGASAGSASAGATAATGLVLGSVIKGAIKWEDTGSLGQGIAEASIELVMNACALALKAQVPKATTDRAAATVQKVVIGLVFGLIKAEFKVCSGSYVSPHGLARGKQKTIAELLLPALAGVPSAAAKDILGSLAKDPNAGWLIPATVALKLMLKYGARGAAKAAKPAAPRSAWSDPRELKPLSKESWAQIRAAIHSTHSSFLLDCARPVERFVQEYALHPMACR
jgi:hypothetical protein